MTEPQQVSASSTRDHIAYLEGQWNPGTFPMVTAERFPELQAATSAATRTLMGGDGAPVEFHLVGTRAPGGRVYRSRWRVEAHGFGPSLQIGVAGAHPSQLGLMLREYPHSQVRQFVADDDWYDMPFMSALAAIVPAMLLCDRMLKPDGWGVTPIPITVGTIGTGEFVPTRLVFRDMFNAPIAPPDMGSGGTFSIPIETEPGVLTDIRKVVSYCFDSRANGVSRPTPFSLWLVTAGAEPRSWRVSYCVDDAKQGPSQRWDLDSAHPEWDVPPEFDPLPWPAPTELGTIGETALGG